MVGSLPEGALAVSGGAVLTVEAPYLQGPFQVFHVRAAMLAGIAVLKNSGGVLWGVQLACLARDLQLPCCTMLAGGGIQIGCRKGTAHPGSAFPAQATVQLAGPNLPCNISVPADAFAGVGQRLVADALHVAGHAAATASNLPPLLPLVTNAAFPPCCLQ